MFYMKRENERRNQTLRSAQYGMEIIFEELNFIFSRKKIICSLAALVHKILSLQLENKVHSSALLCTVIITFVFVQGFKA